MIDPEFWSDEEIGMKWSHGARLFYIGLWNFADDEGRFKAHNQLLKSQIFPYDHKIDIEKLKTEISRKIQWYVVDGLQYGLIRNFLKHQKIDRPTPSRLPTPPELIEDSSNIHRGLDERSRPIEENIKEVNRKEVNIYVAFEKATLDCWNQICESYPVLSKIKELSDNRKQKLKKRFEKESFRDFNKILDCIKESPFLLGENDRQWKVTFDWLIENDTNYLKVLEGRYFKKQDAASIRARLGLKGQ